MVTYPSKNRGGNRKAFRVGILNFNIMSFESELNQVSNLEGINVNAEALVANGDQAKVIFCKGWPATKMVLEALKAMLPHVAVKTIIGVIIKAGDALSSRICG